MTRPTQTVSYNGETYAPIQSQLPFTTSGTFETAKFRLIQGVSGADLAAPTGAALVGQGTWTVAQVLDAHRRQNAGGSTSSGLNVIHGYSGNAVASDIDSATISGGGVAGRENVVGGDGSLTVNTATSNVASTGTGADYSVIGGGYDNVAGGLASVITGFHCYTAITTTHGTISGGSVHKIVGGNYSTIAGGTLNTITGGTSNSTVGGGSGNTVDIAAGQDNGTIAGGYQNSVTARHSTVGGGITNTASGVASTVAGGQINTASGAQASISGGDTNTAGGIASFAGGGFTNILSATASRSDYSGIVAGYQNTIGNTAAARFSGILAGRANLVNAEYAATVAGRECTVTGEAAVASGYGVVANTPGQKASASGYFAAAGDAQESVIVMRRQTTDATATELRAGSALGARLLMPVDTTWAFSIMVVARRTDADNESAAFKIEGAIDRNTAASPNLVAAVTKTVIARDSAAWDVTVQADGTNSALQIQVTGEAAKTINWVARVTLVQVTG